MDNLRGTFGSGGHADEGQHWDSLDEDEDGAFEAPPQSIGQDERRMQVRAYNHWASLLGDRNYPSIEDLEPHNLDDFGPNSVLLDFSAGVEDPAVQYLGDELGAECGANHAVRKLSDVPPRSLLSRITDHYMQILANQSPIGFEAEFVNQAGNAILYRGILLPFSSDDDTIDFIYGVINWKEIADQVTSDELLLEIDQVLQVDEQGEVEDEPHKHHADPVTEWADSPACEGSDEALPDAARQDAYDPETDDEIPGGAFCGPVEPSQSDADEAEPASDGLDPEYVSPRDDLGLPLPDFGQYSLDDSESEFGEEDYSVDYGDDEDEDEGESDDNYSFASLSDYIETPAKKAIDLDADQFDPVEYQPEYGEGSAEGASFGDGSDDDLTSANEFEASPFDEPTGEDAEQESADNHEAPLGEVADEETAIDLAQFLQLPDAGAPLGDFATGFDAGESEDSTPDALADEPFETAEAAEAVEAVEAIEAIEAVKAVEQGTGLYDCLASARELAETARISEDRSRAALYAAVSRAYDVSLAAQAEPQEYAELLEDNGLVAQDRAPMTPVVKLVFGADYDKTRLTEYAAVLAHAHRHGLERGALADFLAEADGGLKGVVAAERRLRREDAGKPVEDADEVRAKLAKKLRELEAMTFDAVAAEGAEFSLVMVRRDGAGEVAVIGEIEDDIKLIERAARKLVG